LSIRFSGMDVYISTIYGENYRKMEETKLLFIIFKEKFSFL